MDIFRMRCFVSAAKTLNYSHTARELFVTQPAVTQQISALESELGVTLFIREGRRMTLTKVGAILAAGFENILLSYDSLCVQVKAMQNLDSELRIGYHGPIDWGMMSSLVYAFEKSNPETLINLRTDHWGTLVHDLSIGSLDVVFTEKSEMEAYPNLSFIELFTEGACVCIPKEHPLASSESINIEQLQGIPIIMTTSPKPSTSMKTIINRLEQCGVNMEHVRYVNQFETAITMVAAGMGMTLLPRSFRVYEHSQLAFPDLELNMFYMEMVLAYSPNIISPAGRKFVDLCGQWDFGV